MIRWYKLMPDKTIQPQPGPMGKEFLGWWTNFDNRRVALTEVSGVGIHTDFLALDHSYEADGPPILFETMVFGGKYDEGQWRCATYEEALKQHEMVVALVRGERGMKKVEYNVRLTIDREYGHGESCEEVRINGLPMGGYSELDAELKKAIENAKMCKLVIEYEE